MTVTGMLWRQLADQPGLRELQQIANFRPLSIWRLEFWKIPQKKILAFFSRGCPVVPAHFLKMNNLYISPNTCGFIETTSFPSPPTMSLLLWSSKFLLRCLSSILKFLENREALSSLWRHLCHKLESVPGVAWCVCVCLYFPTFFAKLVLFCTCD